LQGSQLLQTCLQRCCDGVAEGDREDLTAFSKGVIIKSKRGVAQLVARTAGGREVAGSSPVTPTNTILINKYKMSIKTLKFKSEIVEPITSGKVYKTWRLFDDKQLEVDDILQLVNSDTKQEIGYARITKITIKHLADLDEADMRGHRQYNDIEEIVTKFKKFYGPKVNSASVVKVIEFNYLGQNLSIDDEINTTLITEVKIYTDGGSRGNPGPSACSYVIVDGKDNILKSDGLYLGVTTNNQAEYQAVLNALKAAQSLGIKKIHIFADSLLIVNQLNGVYKIKNYSFWPIVEEIKERVKTFDKVNFTHIPREMNRLADEQVNTILDNQAIDNPVPKML
jgi:ribonuclease HI